MRRWIRRAANLYPKSWRERYGAEFDALLEDVRPGWREFLDVLGGALHMQITSGSQVKLAAAFALAGATLAGALSFTLPRRYISSAVVRITPASDREQAASDSTIRQIRQMEQDALSHSSLIEIIRRPSLDLYKGQRRRQPMEEIMNRMRNEDIQIRFVDTPPAIEISFAYPDRQKAQAVVRALASRFVKENAAMNRLRERTWQDVSPKSVEAPAAANLEVLESASLPTPVGPNRLMLIGCGLLGGLLLGLMAAVAGRRPKRALRLAGFALAGSALGGAGSFLITDRYTSNAVMRFTEPLIPNEVAGMPAAGPPAERLATMQQEILSRGNLAALMRNPRLDLYAAERAARPLEDVVEIMRRNIAIRMLDVPDGAPGNPSAFRISFTYPDRRKAQAAVRELLTQFTERNILNSRARWKDRTRGELVRLIEAHKMGENLEVLDAASMPEVPVSPNRLALTAAGLAFGLLLGRFTLRSQQLRKQFQAH